MAHTDLGMRQRGQAAVEYVGLIAVVAIALAGLAVLVPRPAHEMLSVVERAICAGLGHGCEIGGEESLAFEPCPVRRSVESAEVHATVMSLRAGRGESALVEELSDGSATVTLARGGELGVEGGVGASLAGTGATGGARAEASAGLDLGAGRGYHFDGIDDAMRFVADQRAMDGLARATRLVSGPGCVVCELAGLGPEEPPEPNFTYLEGGGAARAGAETGAGGAFAAAETSAAGAVGRRVDHDTGEVTRYYRIGGSAAAAAGGPIARAGKAGAEAVLEYAMDRDGTPLALTVRSTREATASTGLAAHAPGALGSGGGGGSYRGGGQTVEQVATLALVDRRDRVATARLVEAIGPPSDPRALSRRLRAVDRRLEVAGELDRQVFSTSVRESGLSGDAALGLKLGGGVARARIARTLTAARTRPAGATLFLDRTDCLG